MHLLGIFLILLVNTEALNHHNFSFPKAKNDSKDTSLNWTTIEKIFQQTVNSLLKDNLFKLYKLSQAINLQPSCQSSLMQIVLGLRDSKRWAIHMVDASGKIPSGILEGTVLDFGSYEECLKIIANDSSGAESFRGRYCMVGFSSPLFNPFKPGTSEGKAYIDKLGYPADWAAEELIRAGGFLKRVAFWLGTCIPSVCTEDDLTKIIAFATKPLGFNSSIADCQVNEQKTWPLYTVISVCILGIISSLCVIGTTVDVFLRLSHLCMDTNYSCLKIIKAFSLLSNTEKFVCNIPESGTLGCFHGIRFFSATWIILGHTYFFTDTWKYLKYRGLLNLQHIFNHHFPLAVIENFTIPVGSFFFMSGFLLVYSTWKKLEKNNGKINLLLFFIHKYWRMTPALGLMILMLFAMPLINSGPLWKSTLDPPILACQKNWWTNMLYINNWWNSDEFCIIHTWYLAALMQFHLVGVIVLMCSYRWPIVGAVLGIIITLGSCIFTSLIVAWNNYPMPAPAYIRDMDIVDDYNTKIYIKTYNHTASYFIGMLTAHMVLRFKDKKLPLIYQIFGWLLAIFGSLSSVYGLYGPADSLGVRMFYIGFHRIGWALGVSWLTYVCVTGSGGIINQILSWKAFIPLGHLSYLVYLIHPLVILYRNASLREKIYYGHTELVFEYLTYTVVSFFLAFIGYITVEVPFSVLEEMTFKKSSSINLKTDSNKPLP